MGPLQVQEEHRQVESRPATKVKAKETKPLSPSMGPLLPRKELNFLGKDLMVLLMLMEKDLRGRGPPPVEEF